MASPSQRIDVQENAIAEFPPVVHNRQVQELISQASIADHSTAYSRLLVGGTHVS